MTSAKKPKLIGRLNDLTPKSDLMCYLIPFVCFSVNLIYLLLTGKITSVGGYYLIHLVYTYDHGFVARGLIGEIISWFTDVVTDEITLQIMIIFNIILLVCCSLFIGRMLTMVRNDKQRFQYLSLILIVIFVLGSPLNIYFQDSKLDKVLWALTFLSMFLINSSKGIYIVPFICILATLINPVFLFCSMILVSIALLQEFCESSHKIKNGIICAVSYITMIAIGLYAPISERFLGFETPREMIDFYFARYDKPLDPSEIEWLERTCIFDYFGDSFASMFRSACEIFFIEWDFGIRMIFLLLIAAIPLFVLFILFWKEAIKIEENKLQKLIFFFCAIHPVVLIPPVLISWEFHKYFLNYFLVQVCLVIYFIVKNNRSVLAVIEKLKAFCKNNLWLTLIILSCFISFVAAFSNG